MKLALITLSSTFAVGMSACTTAQVALGEHGATACVEGDGTCVKFTCVTGFSGDYCQTCTPGYTCTGDVATAVDECTGNTMCKNGSTCVDGMNAYTCTGCTAPRAGDHCDECVTGHSGADCTDCASGYEKVGAATDCTVIDQCGAGKPGENACKNGGTCATGVSTYTCTCTGNWAGDTCEACKAGTEKVGAATTCTDIDECDGNVQCKNGSTCVNGDNTFTCAGCVSPRGGDHCDECVTGHSGTDCTDCASGYEKVGASTDCTAIDQCAAGKPGNTACKNGGTCVTGVDTHTCTCTGNWGGATCEDCKAGWKMGTGSTVCNTCAHGCATGATCAVDAGVVSSSSLLVIGGAVMAALSGALVF